MKNRKKLFFPHMFIHFLLIIGSMIVAIPFVIMLFSSFKNNAEIMKVPITLLPQKATLTNYSRVFASNILEVYMNTIFVAVMIVFFQLLTGSMAAYSFARLDLPYKKILFIFVLSLCMLPTYMTIIPRFRMLSYFGLSNKLMGIVMPNAVSITVVFFLRQNFLSFPKELEEAAEIDGAGYVRIFMTILLPLQKTALSAMGIMVLLFAWNDLLWPNIIISSESKRVLSIYIASSQGAHNTEYGYLMASGCVAIIPTVIAYAFGQKAFISSVAFSGIKG